MSAICREFRSEWLSSGGKEGGHAESCPECARWTRSTGLQVKVLSELSRLPAPLELERGVEAELGGDSSGRLARILASLVRRGAPSTLDEKVAALFGEVPAGDESRGERRAQSLRALDVRPAPPVLERLLDEELHSAELHRSERFSGSLERLAAPQDLAREVESRVRRRALLRLLVGPLLTVTAAGVVVWLTLRQSEDSPRAYPFEVVHAATLDGLDPMARLLAESLSGRPGGQR